jgi:probable rRNA maturation factor
MITVHNRQRKIKIDKRSITSTVRKILSIVGYPDFDIGILLTNNATIRRYNREYRSKDKPTDILSFQYHEHAQPGKKIRVKEEEDKNLGDLILSLEYIASAAQELHVTFDERLTVLLVHGICHLLGYDHETDTQWRSMRAKEAFILKKLKA